VRGLGDVIKILKRTENLPAFSIEDDKYRSQVSGDGGDSEGLDAHIADTGNPHDVTALQVGADALGSAATVQQNLENHSTDITVHFTEGDIDHNAIQNVGSNTHTQIDTHIASSSNPHSVSLEQARTVGNTLAGPIDADGNKITGLPTPTSNTDATPKSYVDGLASGLNILDATRVATTANLASTYLAGDLTASGNGAISIDGVSLDADDRVLVKNQNTATQNGVYYVSQIGDGGTPWILTRATDFDEDSEATNGTFVFVEEGTANSTTGWVITTPDPITIDTTDIEWSQFSSATTLTPGEGLSQNGTDFDVNVDDSTIEINSDTLRVKDGGITNAKLDKSNIPLSGFGAATGNVDLGNNKIVNLATPTASTDAATKAYVDSAPTGGTVTTKTANYNAVAGDIVLCNTSGGEFTITLPPAASNANAQITIKKITEDGYQVIVDANGGETIDNGLVVYIDGAYDTMLVVSDGSNWWII